MKGATAIYLGRLIPKENFRTFIYAPNGSQKLVESWDAFEAHMESGVWFATATDAQNSVANDEPKVKPRIPKDKKEKKMDTEDASSDDDFLPKVSD